MSDKKKMSQGICLKQVLANWAVRASSILCGGHGVNLNIISYLGNYSKPVCSCVRLVNNFPYLTSVSFLNIAYQSRFGETCPLSFNSKSAIAHYLIRFSVRLVLRHSSDGG